MQDLRPTYAVVRILRVFLDDLSQPQYGYGLMRETGFSSAKVYQILIRLTDKQWVVRHENKDVATESGGPPRVTYELLPEAVPAARRLVSEAHRALAPSTPKRKATGSVFLPRRALR